MSLITARPHGHTSPGRTRVLVTATALLLAACAGADTAPPRPSGMPDNPACRSPGAAPDASARGSFEDANLVAGGEMFRVYGADADPLREEVTGEVVNIGGQPVWKLDATYAVTMGDQRRSDTWMLWIGFADDGFAVLCAEGPPDVAWPPASGLEASAPLP